MSNLTNLKARVEAVTKNLAELDHLEEDQTQRLNEALDSLRNSFRSKQVEIEEKLDQIGRLTQENGELQKLLDQVLGFIERKDSKGFDDFLQSLDRKLGEVAQLGMAETTFIVEPLAAKPQAAGVQEGSATQASVQKAPPPPEEKEPLHIDAQVSEDDTGVSENPRAVVAQATATDGEDNAVKDFAEYISEQPVAAEFDDDAGEESSDNPAQVAKDVKDSLNALEDAIYGDDVDEELTLEQDAVAETPEDSGNSEDDDGSAEIAELAELQPAYAEKKPDEPEYDPSEDDDDSSIFDILQRAHAVVRRR